jgi:hypothetical protein
MILLLYKDAAKAFGDSKFIPFGSLLKPSAMHGLPPSMCECCGAGLTARRP